MSHEIESIQKLPVLALRDLVVFPGTTIPLLIGRKLSVGALQMSKEVDRHVILVTHKNPDEEEVNKNTIYDVGVVAKIVQHMTLEDGNHKILVDCLYRIKIGSLNSAVYKDDLGEYDLVLAEYERNEVDEDLSSNLQAVYANVIKKLYNDMGQFTKLSKDNTKAIEEESSLKRLIVSVLATISVSLDKKQIILEENTLKEAAKALITLLTHEIDALETQKRIQVLVQSQISKNQREYYLNEQIKAINKELDDLNDNGLSELERLEEKVLEAKMPKEAEEKALNEIKRLKSMPTMSSEGTVARTYIDWLLKMPWNKRSRLRYGLVTAQRRLDEDHAGLEKIKERILEYLAVVNHTRTRQGNILCFIGPPGVGKTSLARSIAETTGREFVRMSLGGVHDESEIRGHRRTYIGAMPGKIVQLLTKAETKNPLILLDEIDKTGSDHRGDPANALLEVLDPEQNSTFNDHYLDVDVDLSEVMFVATANSYNIPGPLRDRMDIIELSSYTEHEKLEIAKGYLIPNQLEEHKIKPSELVFSDEVILELIRSYTKEAGVRNLDRVIASISRKFIKERLLTKDKKELKHEVISETLVRYLGAAKYRHGIKENKDEVGYVNGLAWTQLGGDLLGIEVELVPGKGELILTGSLGDVMKESMRTALTVIRARTHNFGLPHDFYKKWDIHVHAPEGAVPKDGPSAGGAITLAILSALLNVPIRADIAMTGEITLRGKILAIGGLKEKLIAAARAGIKTVLIPQDNEKDLEEVPENIRNQLEIIPISNIDEVIKHSLVKPIEYVGDLEKYSGFYELPRLSSDEENNHKTH